MPLFLLQFGRRKHRTVGDGNCLFRCLSYYVFGTQEQHLDMRSFLTEFMSLNPSEFVAFCNPLSVSDHLSNMKQNFIWGTHAEIFAAAISFRRSVFVAVPKTDQQYLVLGKIIMMVNQTTISYSLTTVPELLHDSLTHFEICLENYHYDVVLTSDGSTSCTPPFTGESSSHIVIIQLNS